MQLHHAYDARRLTPQSSANQCAQCGERLLAPEWSEHLGPARVRHLWECNACGYKFETLVQFRDP